MQHLFYLLLCILPLAYASQLFFTSQPEESWNNKELYSAEGIEIAAFEQNETGVHLSPKWNVVGPFPAGMREHQLGAFPALTFYSLPILFNLSHPVQLSSAYGKAGYIAADAFEARVHVGGNDTISSRVWQSLRISYPHLDWSSMRQSTGWAGIQWQALSVTDMLVEGPSIATLGINLDSAAEFAIMSEKEFLDYVWDDCSSHTKWYNGDWYAYDREGTSHGKETVAHHVQASPGKYKVLVKSVYEVRIFGDTKDSAPEVEFGIDIRLVKGVDSNALVAISTGQSGVVPDVVDGLLAGWGISFALQNNGKQWIQVEKMEITGECQEYLSSTPVNHTLSFAPHQLRPASMKVDNVMLLPSHITTLQVKVHYKVMTDNASHSKTRYLIVPLPLKHVKVFTGKDTNDDLTPYKYTYQDFDQTVQYAIATPPKRVQSKQKEKRPALMYLHGAGVDVRSDEAQRSILQQAESWVIQPSGRSPWGYDWQTLSHISAFTALEQFALHLHGVPQEVKVKAAEIDTHKVMITGHSNGGQGVYHYASHRPDEVIGVVVGAGYISLAEYVPLTWQLGRHFNDALLSGILRSSLNAFENDLFASNLAGLPLLIKYGSTDDNVPIWHSREMASLVESWNRQGRASRDLISISEVPNKAHYWEGFMKEGDVQNAINARLQESINPRYRMPDPLDHFTLTVFNPEDSGSKQGWKITQVEVPGRIGRVEVEFLDDKREIKARTAHVLQVQVDFRAQKRNPAPTHLDIDGTRFVLPSTTEGRTVLNLHKTRSGWSETAEFEIVKRPIGPLLRFLSSSGPIQAIIPTDCDSETTQHYLSIARRFSADAYLYGRLDVVILFDYVVLETRLEHQTRTSNMLLLGGPTVNKVSRLPSTSQSLVRFLSGSCQFAIRNRTFAEGSTLLTLFPHPFVEEAGEIQDEQAAQRPIALLLHGTDSLSIERGYNLLPVRTGTFLPEWIVVDKTSMWKGYGGVVGAGWYDHEWDWSEAMSYLS